MSKKILIVEDNESFRNSLNDLLRFKNYTTHIAKNGADGLNSLKEFPADLIISDIMMPQMDGFEFLEHIRNERETELIPVILLTAKTDFPDRLKGLKLGADAYLAKPFHFRELEVVIEQLLTKQDAIDRRISDKADSKELSADEKFLRKLKTIIETLLAKNDLEISEVCREMNTSYSTLHRQTKRLTGLSPKEYIRLTRLNRARALIREGYGTISEVAFACGFSSPSYFSQSYRSHFGIAPKEDRV